ncbi:hypothetical protein SISNIDRAFT_490846 [Sistotremastrum niveocremeum HHB9708]|uniref:DUF4219 domain-containing protein n=1 Tax=Sistotremastrum niveocremeum HHB9708 TaxID=1314777 RepID=A0A164NDP2_9AGAM|nr:hypothetical protein SISNIDRAFT_490846 [Sistotremastrum niveocremeum HHB9708]
MNIDSDEKTSGTPGSKFPTLIRGSGHAPSNFHTWKVQAKAVFEDLKIWSVVSGGDTASIPKLVADKTIKAKVNGVLQDVVIPGNEEAHAQALADNADWIHIRKF